MTLKTATRERYGERTLHEEHGVAVALNVGDLLIGEGYRLIAESGADPRVITELLRIAATGQRSLCLGQGAELSWARRPAADGRATGSGDFQAEDGAGI